MTAVGICNSCGARIGDVEWCSQCFASVAAVVAHAAPATTTFEALPTAPWAMPAGATAAPSSPAATIPSFEVLHPPRRNVRYASWWQRFKAYLLDQLLVLFIAVLALYGGMAPEEASMVWLPIAILNSVVLQGLTGQTMGKRVVCIQLVRARDLGPVGMGRCFFRQVATILNILPLSLGFLVLIWDKKRRTFADMAAGTVTVG